MSNYKMKSRTNFVLLCFLYGVIAQESSDPTCPPPPSNLNITTDSNGCRIFQVTCPAIVCPQPPVVPIDCFIASQSLDADGCPQFDIVCPPANGQSEPLGTPVCEFGTCDVNEICIEDPRECNETSVPCPQFYCNDNEIGLGFLDKMLVPFGVTINKVPLGGNVGLAYDKIRDLYFALQMSYKFQGVSVKTLRMKIDDLGYCTLDFNLPLTLLSDFNGNPFFNETQPSSLAYYQDHLFWSTKGEDGVGAPHAIRRMGFDGMEKERLQNPPSHAVRFENGTQVAGVKNGDGYSGLSVWENRLVAILQRPLVQDPPLTDNTVSYVRVVEFSLSNIRGSEESNGVNTSNPTGSSSNPSLPILPNGVPGNFSTLLEEYLVPLGPRPEGYDNYGVADIAHIDKNQILILETASNTTSGKFRSWLFLIKLRDSILSNETFQEEITFQATSVTNIPSIQERIGDVNADGPIIPARKVFIREISKRSLDLKGNLDFLQSMSLGPLLSDGTQLLITDTNDQFEGKPRQIQSYVWSYKGASTTPSPTVGSLVGAGRNLEPIVQAAQAVPAFLQSRKAIRSGSSAASRTGGSEFTNTFQGCFEPDRATGLEARRVNDDNLNIRCIEHCRERSYPIAATSGRLCACSQSLLGLTPRVARPEDRNSSGPDSRCNQRCPRAVGFGPCDFDTCCGGTNNGKLAYSVFVVGGIDTIRTILTRAKDALEMNNFARLKTLYGNNDPDFTLKRNTRLFGHFTQFVEPNPERCFERCKSIDRCQGSAWSDRNSMVHARFNCWLIPKDRGQERRGTPHRGWTTYLKGKERNFADSLGKRLFNHFATGHGVGGPLGCRQKCLDRRSVCGGATFIIRNTCYQICRTCRDRDVGNCCFLYRYGAFTVRRDSGSYTSFLFVKPEVEIETTATTLNARGENTGQKKCKIAGSGSYSCSASTEQNPSAVTVMEVRDMQRMLIHQLGQNLQPLGQFDLEKDNSGSTQPATVTKTITVSESTEQTWSTESGIDTSYTIGTTIGAEVGVEQFGVSASASVEMSTQFSVGGFFSAGFARTTSTTIEDQISVEFVVPPGQKLIVSFFKETFPLSINWRGQVIASGRLIVKYLGRTDLFFVSETMTLRERTIFVFGRIDFGDREKVVSIARFFDASGDLLSSQTSG